MSKLTKTPKGTSLPLMNLKGKDYLQVAYRIVWFREEEPQSGIETKYLVLEQDRAVCQATITRDGKVVAMATKSEDRKGFADFIEKSETGAIGRALALLGYGTQFTLPDLDEGERLADSPVELIDKPKYGPKSSKPAEAIAALKPIEPSSSVPAASVVASRDTQVASPVVRKPFSRASAPVVASKPVSNGSDSAAEFD